MYKKLQAFVIDKGTMALRVPIQHIPFQLKKQAIEKLLYLQFKQTLVDGDLDFLQNRWLKINVRDLDLTWFVSLVDDKLQVSQDEIADVTFSGQTKDLILVATRRQDPDTLFFHRKLIVEGDTELGLRIKNMMDAFDLDTMPKMLRVFLEKMADLIEEKRNV